jgi:hypothetical protein
MSPKKAHEVSRMASYVYHRLQSAPLRGTRYIVDVGAGQGYLSRALQSLGLHVLALDASAHQTTGAEKWQNGRRNKGRKGQAQLRANVDAPMLSGVDGFITHKTVHITPETLLSAVDDWISESTDADGSETLSSRGQRPSVLFVGLHACGSLTPDILRAVLAARADPSVSLQRKWTMAGAIVVGCCYNLMSPSGMALTCDDYSLRHRLTHLSQRLSSLSDVAKLPCSPYFRPESPSTRGPSPAALDWRRALNAQGRLASAPRPRNGQARTVRPSRTRSENTGPSCTELIYAAQLP